MNAKRKSKNIPENVFLDESTAFNSNDSCELFAKFFKTVYADDITSLHDADLAASNVPVDCLNLTTFYITPNMILNAAKKLKRSYTPGPDGIPSIVFCCCAEFLALPLSIVFNQSFSQAHFPSIWKDSYMFPVFKTGDRSNIRNYRGITNLSAASKLFEIIVAGVVLSETRRYISVDQHGFIPGRSVSTNLLNFTSVCLNHIQDRAQVDVIYTDLKAAFDKIDHLILLKKISRLGASQQFVSWLSSYLIGRTLRVVIGSSVSSAFTNVSGVPQGSNIGPLLFIIFFNDVAALLDNGCYLFYADDLKIFKKVKSTDDCYRLQALLDRFVEWCRVNKLIVSTSKCVSMTFYRIATPIVFNYQIDGTVLSRVNRVNDLGVQFDVKLSFNDQFSAMITKANRQLGFIAKVSRDFNSPYCLKALYCALVRPILEYASIVWSPYQIYWDLRIENVQRRFIRFALKDLPWNDPYNLPPYPDRCRLLSLDTIQQRRKLQQIIFVAKLLRGDIDSPKLLSQLNFRTAQHSLRTSSLLQLPYHRTEYGYNEPFTSCIRNFLLYEHLFEFDEPVYTLRNKIVRTFH